jgi:hypothetical protein
MARGNPDDANKEKAVRQGGSLRSQIASIASISIPTNKHQHVW